LVSTLLARANSIKLQCSSTTNSIVTSNELEFNFQSHNYPDSLTQGASQLCTLVIDHDWRFSNGTDVVSDDAKERYQEFCNQSGGSPGDGGTNSAPHQVPKKPDICQIKLSFEEFRVQPPILGDCKLDKMFVVAGGNQLPVFCGRNDGQHVYIDVTGKSTTELNVVVRQLQDKLYSCPDRFGLKDRMAAENLTMNTEGRSLQVSSATSEQELEVLHFDRRRAWNLKVQQIPCGCTGLVDSKEFSLAPDGCLSFHPQIAGDIKTFNFDHAGCYSHARSCDSSDLESCAMTAGYTGHYNNLDYSICFEQQYGFCGIEFSPADRNEIGSFSLTNETKIHIPTTSDASGSASGDVKCQTDYLMLHGGHCKNDKSHYETDRFCGNSLGPPPSSSGPLLAESPDSQTIVSYKRPFTVQVVTDADELTASLDYMNRGFHLAYHQLPCQ